MKKALGIAASVAAVLCGAACSPTSPCGPTSGEVADVHDGDTITLTTGEKIRYLMVDAPEVGSDGECYGTEARSFNESLVAGQKIELRYDVECEDRFERLLAYVSVGGREVNTLLVERGYACVLHIEPNGDARLEEFQSLQDAARSSNKGLWGFCATKPC